MTDGLLRVTKYSLRLLWPIGLVLAGFLVLAPLVLGLLCRVVFGLFPYALYQSSEIHLLFLGVSWFLFLGLCFGELQQIQRMMPQMPVRSVEIVSGPILSTMGITLVCYLLTNVFYRLLYFDENWLREYWPVTGPTLFLMTLVMVVHSAYWNLQPIGFIRILFWSGFGLGMLYWLLTRYFPQGLNGPLFPWTQVTLSELATMLLVNVIAWIVAVRSFASVRCGTTVHSWMWERVTAFLSSFKHRTLRKENIGFPSAWSAVSRLYWLDSCRTLTLIIALLGCLVFFINLSSYLYHASQGKVELDPNMSPMFGLSALFSIQAAIVILFGGLINSLSTRNYSQMKGYLAGVPLSDRELSAVLLRCILKCVILSLLFVVILGLGGSYIAFVLSQGTDVIRQCWQSVVTFESKSELLITAGYALLAYWIFVANSISLFWLNSTCFAGNLILLLPLLLVASIFGIFYPVFGFVLLLLFVGLSWSATVIAYIQAYRARLIGVQVIWLAALFCLIVPAFYWNFWSYNELPTKLFQSSLLVFTVLPFATIPLAVSWNRHR
ncbi:hypothetical protein [Gimesia algae]|uniref:Uncharacterized protein n=1 Tax=Gimesia algae TaxID=2527971 RepID=A0A517VMA6_9PLAN|nr:hypothetical protein [Gimesia algae]QDT94105.1 hypothetical protein Pan161_57980 [Gimesia algae]